MDEVLRADVTGNSNCCTVILARVLNEPHPYRGVVGDSGVVPVGCERLGLAGNPERIVVRFAGLVPIVHTLVPPVG